MILCTCGQAARSHQLDGKLKALAALETLWQRDHDHLDLVRSPLGSQVGQMLLRQQERPAGAEPDADHVPRGLR